MFIIISLVTNWIVGTVSTSLVNLFIIEFVFRLKVHNGKQHSPIFGQPNIWSHKYANHFKTSNIIDGNNYFWHVVMLRLQQHNEIKVINIDIYLRIVIFSSIISVVIRFHSNWWQIFELIQHREWSVWIDCCLLFLNWRFLVTWSEIDRLEISSLNCSNHLN